MAFKFQEQQVDLKRGQLTNIVRREQEWLAQDFLHEIKVLCLVLMTRRSTRFSAYL